MTQTVPANLFDLRDLSGDGQETFTSLLSVPGVRIERIVSCGQASPPGFWYDQDEHEWVMVLQGRAGLQLEGEAAPRVLNAGDHLLLPAHCRHRVESTASGEATIWLAVFWREAAMPASSKE